MKCSITSDDNWRWLVLVCGMAQVFTRHGSFYVFGIIAAELERIYHTPLTELTAIGTIPFFISSVFSFVPVWLKPKMPRHDNLILSVCSNLLFVLAFCLSASVNEPAWLFLTFSILSGSASCFLNIASVSAIGEYFPKDCKYYVFATTMTITSVPLSKLCLNPIVYTLIEILNWRAVFLFFAGLALFVGIPCSFSFVSKKNNVEIISEKLVEADELNIEKQKSYQSTEDSGHNDQAKGMNGEIKKIQDKPRENQNDLMKKEDPDDWGMWRCFKESDSKAIILMQCLGITGLVVEHAGFSLILPHFLALKSVSAFDASTLITSISAIELVSMLLSALVGKWLQGRLVLVNMVSSGIVSISLVGMVFTNNYADVFACTSVLSVSLGVAIAYTIPSTTEATGLSTKIAWAYNVTSMALAFAIIPIITGTIYDIQNDYNHSFLAMCVCSTISCLLFTAILVINCKKNRMK